MALKILFSPVDSEATGSQRLIYPLMALKQKFGVDYEIINAFDAKTQIKNADAVWLQCLIGPQQRTFIEHCKKRGIPVIIDYDDYFNGVPENIRKRLRMSQDEIEDNWAWYLQQADLVTVPCPSLAEEISKITKQPVKVLPNLITKETYEQLKDYSPFDNTGEIRILYSCSESHLEDFQFITNILSWFGKIYPKVKILTNGNLNFGYYHPNYRGKVLHIGRVSYGSYFKTLADHKPHIFLAPLMDSTYNRCRSDLKFKQAAALKCAFLASNLETYASVQDGVTGLLTSNYRIAWAWNLRKLVCDPEFAKKLGQQANSELAGNLLEDQIDLWYEAVSQLC